jgi:nanoRNase/pAp phosphatase (c-di-AMP/oligoRNAs hydrolase)
MHRVINAIVARWGGAVNGHWISDTLVPEAERSGIGYWILGISERTTNIQYLITNIQYLIDPMGSIGYNAAGEGGHSFAASTTMTAGMISNESI